MNRNDEKNKNRKSTISVEETQKELRLNNLPRKDTQ